MFGFLILVAPIPAEKLVQHLWRLQWSNDNIGQQSYMQDSQNWWHWWEVWRDGVNLEEHETQIPDLKKNLISLRALNERWHKFCDEEILMVTNGAMMFLRGQQKANMYRLLGRTGPLALPSVQWRNRWTPWCWGQIMEVETTQRRSSSPIKNMAISSSLWFQD